MNSIREAAKNLPGHWHKGDYTDGQGNYCGIGHVLKASGLTDEQIEMGDGDFVEARLDVLNKVAGEQFPDRAFTMPSAGIVVENPYFAYFNDHPDTTEDEVLAVMEKAAVVYEETKGLDKF